MNQNETKLIFVLLCILSIVLFCACQKASVKTDGGDSKVSQDDPDRSIKVEEADDVKQTNIVNSWVGYAINNAMWLIILLIYVFFSKRFPIVGRK